MSAATRRAAQRRARTVTAALDPDVIRAAIAACEARLDIAALVAALMRAWRRAQRDGDAELEGIACSLAAAAIRKSNAIHRATREARP